ncbi:MAG: hypothetical protein QY317_16135 [Candidatus Jettenia caeni]|nr:MAG: hypothetical protein QY317_16135 [Candidatus Jettenia caeni]
MRELKKIISNSIDYSNFSEEVEILSAMRVGSNYYIYTARNKNGVTFRHVPGIAGLSGRGIMGYVNGDRARPVMIGPSHAKQINSSSFMYGGDGFFAGGYSTENLSVIDTIDISTLSDALSFGNLSTARRGLAACANTSRGVFGGGAGNAGNLNSMEYITFASAGNAVTFGDLIKTCISRVGTSSYSTSRGLFAGGFGNGGLYGYANEIEYITISSTGNATDFGDLTLHRYALAAASDNSRALFAGGAWIEGGGVFAHETALIDYITIATLGNASNFGNLTQKRQGVAGCSNTTRAVFGGGSLGYDGSVSYNILDYVTIASTGNAIDFGDLTTNRNPIASCASSGRGLFAGGSNGNALQSIDYIAIASTGNATDFGDLTGARTNAAGCAASQ